MDRGDASDMTAKTPIALTIAGSDSGAGAGVQADLRTFAALGVYGASVVTALTAQNTEGVRAIELATPDMVAAQIDAVLKDFAVAAIKIGMLGSAEIAGVVAERLGDFPSPLAGEGGARSATDEGSGARIGRPEGRPSSTGFGASRRGPLTPNPSPARGEGRRLFIVYDPVMVASSGDLLSGAGFVEAIREGLLPLVDCLTPNLAEAAALLGEPVARSEDEMARQGRALLMLGPRAVLMKGGHLAGGEAVDILVTADAVHRLAAPRLASRNLHGTGCTLSSAIAAHIVLGMTLPEAVAAAKAFVTEAIERGQSLTLGAGPGPLIQTKPRATR
jgi:hydroxymethylpyrimidine/phosphomethylpyrimidine kinase